MDLENDPIIKIVKFEAFPIVSRPNKGAHRVLRSILDKNRPVGRTLEIKFFFVKKRPVSNMRKALNVLILNAYP